MPPSMIYPYACAAFAVSLGVTWWLIGALGKSGLMDVPNARSSHQMPVPRGGGLGILAAVLPLWSIALGMAPWLDHLAALSLFLGLAAVASVSFLDDRGGMPWSARLGVQAASVGAVLAATLTLSGPAALALGILLMLAWLWLINGFNFMDGIDGIAATEAITVSAGAALVFTSIGAHPALVTISVTLATASAGFLVWNWAPARIILGDVGSVPLGYLLGFLMLWLIIYGYWGAALALPSYFYADSTLTLLARAWRGATLTEAHREHFYQRASTREKATHAMVVRRVAVANVCIIGAVWAGVAVNGMTGQLLTVGLATVINLLLLGELTRLARKNTR